MTTIEVIKQKLLDAPILSTILGGNKEKYISSVLVEISKTMGTDQDLSKCTSVSIAEAIKQACDLNLEIDGRQHCHLLKYGNKAIFRVGYRGYIYSIKKAYPDANIDCGLVYEGDNFTIKKEGDITTYSLERNNPFADKEDIIGGFCYISYSLHGKQISFCETMSLEEINRVKSVAKTKTIWDKWFEEKARVAIIRRACKHHFSAINENLAKIEEYDNQDFSFEDEPVTINQKLAQSAYAEDKEVKYNWNKDTSLELINSIENMGSKSELEGWLEDKEVKSDYNRLEKYAKELYDEVRVAELKKANELDPNNEEIGIKQV